MGATSPGYDTARAGMANVMNYQPQMVGGGFTPQSVAAGQQGYNYTPQSVAAGQGQYNYTPQSVSAGSQGYNYSPTNVSVGSQGYNYNPTNVSGGSFLEGNVGAYMDPYVQNVENQAMGRLEDQRLQAQNSNADAAIRNGAFGGSRHGVVEGVTNAESAKAAGELSANLRSQAYNNARGLQGQDLARSMQAGLSNQQAGLNNAQFGANIGLQNLQNQLQSQLANQQAGMGNAQFGANIGLQNIQNNMQAQLANQQAGMGNAQFGANLGMQNIGNNLQAALANQQAGLNNAQFGANVGLQNIGNNLNAQQFNANMGLQGAQLNQHPQLANQQAGLTGAGLNMQAAAGYGDLTGAQQAANLQGINAALQGGNMNQQYQQQLLDQTANQYNAMRQYPVDLFNMRSSALNGLQLPTSTTGPGGGGLASGIMGGLGGALTGAGLFGTGGALAGLGGISGGAGAGIGSILGLLGGLSDEREKTNIEKLGTDEETGLDIYAYDYKADVKASKKNKRPMPMKRVGPMAQDIEKMYPGSTREIGGKMVVSNLGFGG
jgi:hypothetical protein